MAPIVVTRATARSPPVSQSLAPSNCVLGGIQKERGINAEAPQRVSDVLPLAEAVPRVRLTQWLGRPRGHLAH